MPTTPSSLATEPSARDRKQSFSVWKRRKRIGTETALNRGEEREDADVVLGALGEEGLEEEGEEAPQEEETPPSEEEEAPSEEEEAPSEEEETPSEEEALVEKSRGNARAAAMRVSRITTTKIRDKGLGGEE